MLGILKAARLAMLREETPLKLEIAWARDFVDDGRRDDSNVLLDGGMLDSTCLLTL